MYDDNFAWLKLNDPVREIMKTQADLTRQAEERSAVFERQQAERDDAKQEAIENNCLPPGPVTTPSSSSAKSKSTSSESTTTNDGLLGVIGWIVFALIVIGALVQ